MDTGVKCQRARRGVPSRDAGPARTHRSAVEQGYALFCVSLGVTRRPPFPTFAKELAMRSCPRGGKRHDATARGSRHTPPTWCPTRSLPWLRYRKRSASEPNQRKTPATVSSRRRFRVDRQLQTLWQRLTLATSSSVRCGRPVSIRAQPAGREAGEILLSSDKVVTVRLARPAEGQRTY